jgi:octaprenyl-diphosphate synthase
VDIARADRVSTKPPAPTLLVARELDLVERRLQAALKSREPRLTEIAEYLIGSGGKRVRPAVTLLTFRACGGGGDLDDVVDVAVALELIHSASLLHDDIIDGSASRRGRDSAFRKYGLAESLVAGDFLFGRAYQLCARFDEKLINWAVDASISLTEGEIMQGRFRRNPDVTLADYMEIVTRKTAALFEQGARTAATLAKAPPAMVEALARCGLHIGLTFQIIDDLLDVSGAEEQLGKPVGIDIREGNPSLPIVLALPRDDEVRRVFARPKPTETDVSRALDRLRRSKVMQQGRALAAEHAATARDALSAVPESTYRQNLFWLIDELVERVA